MINRLKEIIRWWLDVLSTKEHVEYRKDFLAQIDNEIELSFCGSKGMASFRAEMREANKNLRDEIKELKQWLPIRVAQHGGFYKMRVRPKLNDYEAVIFWVYENTESDVWKSSCWKTASEAEKAGYLKLEKLEEELNKCKGI